MKPEEKIERAYEEFRAIIDGGSESFTHEDAVQYLKDKLAQPDQYAKGYADAMNWKTANHLEHLPAQPEQEPVGYEHHEKRPLGAPNEIRIHAVLSSQYELQDGTISKDFEWLIDSYRLSKNTIKLLPLYTTPPQRKPLTDEQLKPHYQNQEWLDGVRFAEAAHGIKE